METPQNSRNNQNPVGRSQKALLVVVLVLLGVISAACGKSTTTADGSDPLRDQLVTMLAEGAGVGEDTAACIVDKGLESYTIEELATFGNSDPDPEVMAQIAQVTQDCILANGELSTLLANHEEVGTADDDPEPETDDPQEAPDTPTPDPEPTPEPTPIAGPEEHPDAGPTPKPAPLTVTSPEFCASSRDAYETFLVLDYLPQDIAGGAVEVAFAQLLTNIGVASGLAPNAELAEAPLLAFQALARIDAVAAQYDYDGDFLQDYEDEAFLADVDTFGTVMEALERYLAGPCGYDEETIEGDAESRAAQLEYDYADTPPHPEPNFYVADAASGIDVEVPSAWTDVAGWREGDTRTLIVAPDVAEFDRTWNADGVMITATDLDGRLTYVNTATPVSETAAWNDCFPSEASDYDDGVYEGQIFHLTNCGGTDTTAVVIGATNSDHTQLVIVEIQMTAGSEDVTAMVIDSFIA